jgi:hypothetical protein
MTVNTYAIPASLPAFLEIGVDKFKAAEKLIASEWLLAERLA